MSWHTNPDWSAVLRGRLTARIGAERVLRDPAADHIPDAWPPDIVLAPLADLVIAPSDTYLAPWMSVRGALFIVGPADGLPAEQVLSRGTRLRPTGHGVDPCHEGLDTDSYEVLDGPFAGAVLISGCGGRYGLVSDLANWLICRSDEPSLEDPDRGARLLADLQAITDDVRASVAAGCPPPGEITVHV